MILFGFAVLWPLVATGLKDSEFPYSRISEWKDDPLQEELSSYPCDIAVYAIQQNSTFSVSWNLPFILKGGAAHWSTDGKWTKNALLEKYGRLSIHYGTESSIVFNGGGSEVSMTFGTFLDSLGNNDSRFIFEPAFLTEMPGLKSDFDIPDVFKSWDSFDLEDQGNMWHMLSIGPSRKGLPFHNHGKSWIGIAYGAKLWFLYPFGYSPPVSSTTIGSAFEWYKDVFPSLKKFKKPPKGVREQTEYDEHSQNHFQPLTCVQETGDIIFIPSQWLHMTMNIGETIAVGGQELLVDEERLQNAQFVYSIHPTDYTVLKDYGLALLNMKRRVESPVSLISANTCMENDSESAEFFLRRSLEINPNQPDVVSILSALYISNRNSSALLQFTNKAAEIYAKWSKLDQGGKGHDPITLASLYNSLATNLMDMELFREAVPMLQRSLSFQPSFKPAIQNLIHVYCNLGDTDSARRTLDHASYHLLASEAMELQNTVNLRMDSHAGTQESHL